MLPQVKAAFCVSPTLIEMDESYEYSFAAWSYGPKKAW
jgi:hypothetical protein